MTVIQSFMAQFILFMMGFIFHTARLQAEGKTWRDLVPDKSAGIIILVIWFGVGTWFRHYTQMGIMGMWEEVLR